MEENNQVQATSTDASTVTTPTAPTTGVTSGPQPDRTFTRDEVTRILKRRIDRYQNSVLTKYGVKDASELDSLFEKAKGYDDLMNQKNEFEQQVAFLSNNINPDKYDDIKTYFKGKGLQFSNDELKRQLETHSEWLKQAPTAPSKPTTTITPVGTAQNGPVSTGEKELARKIYGEDLFD